MPETECTRTAHCVGLPHTAGQTLRGGTEFMVYLQTR